MKVGRLESRRQPLPAPHPESPLAVGATLTQLGDAPHAGGQEGLLQGPELQLSVGVGSLILAQRPAIVGTEVCREGEDACEETRQIRHRGEEAKLLVEQGAWADARALLEDGRRLTVDSAAGPRPRAGPLAHPA